MGALLRGTKREQVKRGQVIAAPGSIKPVKKFKAQVYVRKSAEHPWCRVLIMLLCQVLSKDEGRTDSDVIGNGELGC
jgi:hypothetical protein